MATIRLRTGLDKIIIFVSRLFSTLPRDPACNVRAAPRRGGRRRRRRAPTRTDDDVSSDSSALRLVPDDPRAAPSSSPSRPSPTRRIYSLLPPRVRAHGCVLSRFETPPPRASTPGGRSVCARPCSVTARAREGARETERRRTADRLGRNGRVSRRCEGG